MQRILKCDTWDPEQNEFCVMKDIIYLEMIKPDAKKFEIYVEEIKYPKLSEKEAFDKVYKEMGLRDTFIEKIYCQQHNPKMLQGD